MKIEHVALWTKDIERSKAFYVEFFGAKSKEKYINHTKGFESYFLTFESGPRLEIMQMASIPDGPSEQHTGFIHIAFSVGSHENVDQLTNQLREKGYIVEGEPRTTGDGYYESVILDPDGNRIEITI